MALQAGACARRVPPAPPIPVPLFDRQKTPSSPRSREAMTRIAPALIHDLAERELDYGAPVFLRILKRERELELWVERDSAFVLFRTYRVAAMSGGLGPKLREGDRQAPEGFYAVVPQRMNPNSRFHLSFDIGYPNTYDRAHGRTGSLIMVHGNRVSIGCFAMTDAKIEAIYTLVDAALRNGQSAVPVHVFPFRFTEENLAEAGDDPWHDFWRNLREGYDAFEQIRRPPGVRVEQGRYVFDDGAGERLDRDR